MQYDYGYRANVFGDQENHTHTRACCSHYEEKKDAIESSTILLHVFLHIFQNLFRIQTLASVFWILI